MTIKLGDDVVHGFSDVDVRRWHERLQENVTDRRINLPLARLNRSVDCGSLI